MSDAELAAGEGGGADEQHVDQAGAEPLAADAAPVAPPTPAELSRAMQAFKKRLKLTRLDSESKLGYGPMTGGRPSGIVAIEAPREYPRSVWEALVAQGKLKKSSQGMYEMG